MDKVRYTRIWTDEKGESHFQDIETDLRLANFAPPAPPLGTTAPMPAARWLFVASTAPDYYADFHPTPCRQLCAILKGMTETQTSDGETRIFHAGDCIMLEDTTGKGHRSRNPEEALVVMVQFPD